MLENMPSDALKPQPRKRPLDKLAMGGDVAALNSLLNMMNDPRITGAEVPAGADVLAVDKTGATIVPSDIPAIAAENAKYPGISHGLDSNPLRYSPVKQRPTNHAKIFYTGLIGVGKDHIAEQTGATIFGFADPLYHLAEYFFGITVNSKTGKDIPGVRQFLQAAGQWGRAEVTEKYPLTPARACFISMVRSLGEAGRFDPKYEIVWANYGMDKHLWVNGVNQRVCKHIDANPESRVAATNVRFQPEYKTLTELGWTHFHVMCSASTRAKRVKVTTDSDTSEQLAAFLNNDVTRKISAQPSGVKLRVIWNDSTPAPSPRLYTVPEFLAGFAPATDDSHVMTGE